MALPDLFEIIPPKSIMQNFPYVLYLKYSVTVNIFVSKLIGILIELLFVKNYIFKSFN